MASLSSLPPAEIEKLLAGPAIPPPPGHTPDFAQLSPSHNTIFIEIAISEFVWLTALAARLFTQGFVRRRLSPEDYVILVATVFHIGTDINAVWIVSHGDGKHEYDMTLRSAIGLSHVIYFWDIFYTVCIGLVKVAILLQFIRILAPREGRTAPWIACWVTIFFNGVYYIISTFLQIFRCLPIDAAWNVFRGGHCLSLEGIFYSNAIISIISDLSIIAIPVPIIWRLNLSTKRKLGIASVFAAGILACVVSIVRCYYTYRSFSSPDETFELLNLGYTAVAEMLMGMVVFTMPILPQFFGLTKKGLQSLLTKRTNSTSAASDREMITERAVPKPAREPYEMPSLASFERRGVSQHNTANAVTQLSSVSEVDGWSSHMTKTSNSERSV